MSGNQRRGVGPRLTGDELNSELLFLVFLPDFFVFFHGFEVLYVSPLIDICKFCYTGAR